MVRSEEGQSNWSLLRVFHMPLHVFQFKKLMDKHQATSDVADRGSLRRVRDSGTRLMDCGESPSERGAGCRTDRCRILHDAQACDSRFAHRVETIGSSREPSASC